VTRGNSSASQRAFLLIPSLFLASCLLAVRCFEFAPSAEGLRDPGDSAISEAANVTPTATAIRSPGPEPGGRGQCEGSPPLPLASHWTPYDRRYPNRTTPNWQLEQMDRGHHWLLSFDMGRFHEPWDDWAESYFRPAIDEARRRRIPIALLGTQWERVLYEEPRWKDLPPERSPLVLDPSGRLLPAVSPYGAVEPWAEAGAAWAQGQVFIRLQELYPDPPFVVIVSNNESKKLNPYRAEESLRYRERYGRWSGRDTQRRVLGDGYIERFRALVEGMRSNLTAWRNRSIIIGWGGTNIGIGYGLRWKWHNLPNSGVPVPGRLNIFPFSWDGISSRYYFFNVGGNKSEDYTLRSPHVRIMQMPLDTDFACEHNPDYYWEVSTWFDPVFVERIEKEDDVSPLDRHSGATKWGMWIARPRVVRDFSYGKQNLPEYEANLRRVMDAVDEIHEDADLSSFWRSSEIVRNTRRSHPYSTHIPKEYRGVDRWLGLDTNLDPGGLWGHGTEIPVWALARVQGSPGSRRWLVYVQSPRRERSAVEVRVPELGPLSVRALPAGCYYVAREGDRSLRSVGRNRADCSPPSGLGPPNTQRD